MCVIYTYVNINIHNFTNKIIRYFKGLNSLPLNNDIIQPNDSKGKNNEIPISQCYTFNITIYSSSSHLTFYYPYPKTKYRFIGRGSLSITKLPGKGILKQVHSLTCHFEI